MPELPEVETIRRGLETYIVGHKISEIIITQTKLFHGDPYLVKSATIFRIRRFGKGLIVDLDNGYSLAIHIKMTGQLIYKSPKIKTISLLDEPPTKYTHITFLLDRNAKLYYNDQRRFGWIKVVKTNKIDTIIFFKTLGPEPLKNLTYPVFMNIISKSKTAIKLVLMDQNTIAGIGNIYANDALYLAQIHPKRQANSLSEKEASKLLKAIESVLIKGLEEGGASERNFVNVLGEKGNYQNHTLIYGKKGTACMYDGEIIQKFFLGGRGTYYCGKCQK